MEPVEEAVTNRRPRRSPFGRHPSNLWHRYIDEKAAWLAAHPQATSKEIDVAATRIAARLGL